MRLPDLRCERIFCEHRSWWGNNRESGRQGRAKLGERAFCLLNLPTKPMLDKAVRAHDLKATSVFHRASYVQSLLALSERPQHIH